MTISGALVGLEHLNLLCYVDIPSRKLHKQDVLKEHRASDSKAPSIRVVPSASFRLQLSTSGIVCIRTQLECPLKLHLFSSRISFRPHIGADMRVHSMIVGPSGRLFACYLKQPGGLGQSVSILQHA